MNVGNNEIILLHFLFWSLFFFLEVLKPILNPSHKPDYTVVYHLLLGYLSINSIPSISSINAQLLGSCFVFWESFIKNDKFRKSIVIFHIPVTTVFIPKLLLDKRLVEKRCMVVQGSLGILFFLLFFLNGNLCKQHTIGLLLNCFIIPH